ncbi:DNA polymerase III subunit alpha [Gillisia sp. M10.2A]|uniref:DNA-directed DNA polymerase n=1 Tax=Gillisia lutea TaxID=2909668 RepID=A0ABS9EGB0_9FLAO|nr:DNA polymerase III subunit alpha [Gillisia lutea]MCF4101937.1 DNA polymerase III subunit alpha [Gillisia lutea]
MYLNNHTYYSMRYGTFSELELLELAKQNCIEKLVLTDINNTSACLNFVRKAKDYNIQPVLGVDFRNGAQQQFVAIAQNNEGFNEINIFLSQLLYKKQLVPEKAPFFKNAFVVYPFENIMAAEVKDFAHNEFIGVSISELRKLRFSKLKELTHKLVVLQPVTFRNKRDFNAHRLLRAIDNNTLLSKLPSEEQAKLEEQMISIEMLEEAFQDFEFILQNTQKLLDACSIDFDFSEDRKPQNQQVFSESEAKDEALLEQLCKKGLLLRYPEAKEEVFKRMTSELKVIKEMNFISYFLINWRICEYARGQGYFYVGRGSGANSIVAYLLQITEVDPIELDLYFERFINQYRTSPPDFDIDFAWNDREDITRFIFEEFPHTALLATYNTFQYKAVIREIGKVFGLPKEDIDQLCKGYLPNNQQDSIHKIVMKYGELIQGMPNYLSIHAGGILISNKPLTYFSGLDLPPKGFPTVQFDMVIAEDVGLYKFDILAQRGLGKIRDSLAIIEKNQPTAANFDIHDITSFKKDPRINNLIKEASCIGCFYVESPAMRMLLKKLKTNTYLGLVAASSIIRPGVAKSGMMREYILRHRYPERRENAHPELARIMPDTYGIMVYQEDVIKVAHYFAGLSLAEADVLRRGMSGKYRSREEFQRVEEKFISNCKEKKIAEKTIFEVWEQIKSFAGYAFAKGHSASYAVESYQSLFLKAYFPLEYMVATLNNGGGFYSPEMYVHEAKMLGAIVEPPCINEGDYHNTIKAKRIYLGFGYLKELEHRAAQRILENRNFHGKFKSFEDFIDRVSIGIEQLSILIRINAFRFTGIDKYKLLWEAHFKLSKIPKRPDQLPLFIPKHKNFTLPALKTTQLEEAFEQIELLGFPLCSHFDLLLETPRNDYGQKDLQDFLNKNILIYGYLVTVKNTSTTKGERMNFGTFIDSEGHYFDTILFPPIAKKYSFRGPGIYVMYGKVTEEFDFLSIEVIKMRKEAYITDPRFAEDNPATANRIDKMKKLHEKKSIVPQ